MLDGVTVEDLIALRRPVQLTESGDYPLWSADRRRLATLTEKADSRSGKRTFILEVWSVQPLAEYAADDREKPALAPAAGYALSSVGSDPAISRVKWSEDSQILYFIGNAGAGPAQVYAWEVAQQRPQQLTYEQSSVVAYDANRSSVIVSVRHAAPENDKTSGFVVGGERLANLLGLGSGSSYYANLATSVISEQSGDTTSVAETVRGRIYTPIVEYWLSPNGRYAVSIRPPEEIPAAWESYEVRVQAYRMRETKKGGPIPWLTIREYVLIDCASGQMSSLLKAPSGGAAMVPPNTLTATWSPDGRFVVLNSSFLPLSAVEGPTIAERISGPWVVEVEVATGKWRPIRKLPEVRVANTTGLRSVAVSYRNSSDALVVTEIDRAGNRVSYNYSRRGDHWKQSDETAQGASASRISVDVREGLNSPPDLWVTDRRSGRTRRVSEWNPELKRLAVHPAEILEWKDQDGRTWQGGLLLPATAGAHRRVPLVIQTHGFDERQFLWDGPFPAPYAGQVLAEHGMAVLQIQDRREITGSPEEAAIYMDAYLSAIDELRKRQLIDPSRVGLQGFSRTTYHVRYALTHSAFPFRAAVSVEGTDKGYWQYLLAIGDGVEVGRAESEHVNGGQPFGEGLLHWSERAPPFLAHKISVPIRFEVYGLGSLLSNWEMYAALRILERPVEMVVVPDGQHVLAKPTERSFILHGYVDWFRFWLQDYEDAASPNAEQYARWRKLRKQYDMARMPAPRWEGAIDLKN